MYRLKINSLEYVSSGVVKLSFLKPDNLNFVPGQHFSLSFPNKNINREYSSFSNPNSNKIEFLIKIIQDGIFCNELSKSMVNDELDIHGPYGSFILPSNIDINNTKLIFFSSGTGIAPFISFCNYYKLKKFELFHSVRHLNELYIDNVDLNNTNIFITRDSDCPENFIKSRMTNFLSKQEDDYLSKDDLYFLCGNSYMISDIYDLLIDKYSISTNKIFAESFF